MSLASFQSDGRDGQFSREVASPLPTHSPTLSHLGYDPKAVGRLTTSPRPSYVEAAAVGAVVDDQGHGTIIRVMSLLNLLRLVLPHRRTTEQEVRAAMIEQGIDPEQIGWSVNADGSFAFGRKHPDDPALAYEKTSHLLSWAQRRRIKVLIIGWEQHPNS